MVELSVMEVAEKDWSPTEDRTAALPLIADDATHPDLLYRV